MRFGYDKCDGNGCQVISNRFPFPHAPGCMNGPQPSDHPAIQPPTFPDSRPGYGCIARFHCILGCGWFHHEHPDNEPLAPIRLPARGQGTTLHEVLTAVTQDEITQAFAAAHAENVRVRNERLEQAFAAHFAETHPGLPAPILARP